MRYERARPQLGAARLRVGEVGDVKRLFRAVAAAELAVGGELTGLAARPRRMRPRHGHLGLENLAP